MPIPCVKMESSSLWLWVCALENYVNAGFAGASPSCWNPLREYTKKVKGAQRLNSEDGTPAFVRMAAATVRPPSQLAPQRLKW
eukprot:s2451_g5.t1